ncbi:MAG: hypothetical protein ACI4MM_05675 [Candidatus Ventricola sp.]
MVRKLAKVLFLLLLLAPAALAQDAPLLRGYDSATQEYEYATFGVYPYGENGEVAPVLWRVLGWGVPAEDDVICKSNYPNRTDKKYANADDMTQENEDVCLLMTEYIIDTVLYHPERDETDDPGLDYADAYIRSVLCTDVLNTLFTQEEQAALVEMPGRGLLSLPSRRGELFSRLYGFVEEDFVKLKTRSTTGTPYAFSRGLRRIDGNSWYWTTDWRAPGRRWIVGDNGHISVSGLDREGGIRPICYVRTGMLKIIGGDGTIDNPYQLAVK